MIDNLAFLSNDLEFNSWLILKMKRESYPFIFQSLTTPRLQSCVLKWKWLVIFLSHNAECFSFTALATLPLLCFSCFCLWNPLNVLATSYGHKDEVKLKPEYPFCWPWLSSGSFHCVTQKSQFVASFYFWENTVLNSKTVCHVNTGKYLGGKLYQEHPSSTSLICQLMYLKL